MIYGLIDAKKAEIQVGRNCRSVGREIFITMELEVERRRRLKRDRGRSRPADFARRPIIQCRCAP
jgi:hypothetical protein